MSSAALVVSDLHFTYPDGRRALSGVDLRIERGSRVALLGPTGAGKTTLALHLNGILEPERGSVQVGDVVLGPDTVMEVRRRVGLVFQDPDDQLFMPTVHQDVAFGPANLGLSGAALAEAVAGALAAVEATELSERPPHHLSGGERRKAALATVLSMRPDILVLDEPGSGLDPATKDELVTTLHSLAVTQVVITHDLPFALGLCDRCVIMDGGRVVAEGATLDILGDAALLREHRLEVKGFDPTHTG